MLRAFLLLTFLTAIAAPMAQATIILEAVGVTQGPIQGDSTFPGEENKIELEAFSSGSSVYIDPASGTILQRNRADISASKEWDSSSIPLLASQGEEELLSTCIFRFYGPIPKVPGPSDAAAKRMPHIFLIIELVNARVSSYSVAGAGSLNAFENLTFSFDRILYTNPDTGESYTDIVRGPGAPKQLSLDAPGRPSGGGLTAGGFEFVLPATGHVGIDIVDAHGNPVTTLFDDDATSSEGAVYWDGTDAFGRKVPAGLYTATVRTAGKELERRMVIGD